MRSHLFIGPCSEVLIRVSTGHPRTLNDELPEEISPLPDVLHLVTVLYSV